MSQSYLVLNDDTLLVQNLAKTIDIVTCRVVRVTKIVSILVRTTVFISTSVTLFLLITINTALPLIYTSSTSVTKMRLWIG
jgi:hypothetical protein